VDGLQRAGEPNSLRERGVKDVLIESVKGTDLDILGLV
jgi:hypothetical protein